MENTAVIKGAPRIDWRNVVMYDDEGKRITNPVTLESFAEGQELIAEWERRIERTGMGEAMRRYYEGGGELDSEEED